MDGNEETLRAQIADRDVLIEALTGLVADDIAKWFQFQGRADDVPLLLSKRARLTLQPIEVDVEVRHPLPRGWPDEVRDRVMAKVLAQVDARAREVLFGSRAEAHRARVQEVSMRKRNRKVDAALARDGTRR